MITTTSPPQGFVPVCLMLYREDGQIDYPALTRLIHWYLDHGAVGIFANCYSSEMLFLTDEERIAHVQHIVRTDDEHVPVYAGGGFGDSVDAKVDFIHRMADTGTTGVVLITNLLCEENDSEDRFTGVVHQIMQQTESIPLGFYECPVPYRREVSPAFYRHFLPSGRFGYCKDTSCDRFSIGEKLAVVCQMNATLYEAHSPHAVTSLRAGARGMSCITGNYMPDVIAWLCNHYNDPNKTREVERVQQVLTNLDSVFHRDYPLAVRLFLSLCGMGNRVYSRSANHPVTDKIAGRMQALKGWLDDGSPANRSVGSNELPYRLDPASFPFKPHRSESASSYESS